MKHYRKAFTLIELMISVTILSIMILFLYRSYASLNFSNKILKKEVVKISEIEQIKKVISLDFLLAKMGSIKPNKREKNEDFVSFETSHSIHRRYSPFVAYIVKNEKLYRLESLEKISSYDIPPDGEYEIDYLGAVNSFRVYKSSKKEAYLIHIDFKKKEDILLKIKVLNEE